ncbi:MAG: YdgA family protein [Thioploca sp.]|nr:YdgA family protein [Thioploca sp.]
MNRILQPLLISLLLIGTIWFSFPLKSVAVVNANTISPMRPLPHLAQPIAINEKTTPSSNVVRLALQHRFNKGKPLPQEQIEIPVDKITQQPRILLEAIKQNFSTHLEKQSKPVQLNTEIEWLLSKEMTQTFGTLPKLSIQTHLDSNGTGASQLVIPADQRKITKANKTGQANFDWKGLNGLLTFTNQFKAINSQFDFGGLKITTNQGFSLSWDATTFQGLFDANLRPSQLDLKLPLLKLQQDDNNALLQTFIFQFNTEKTQPGLELGNLKLNVNHFGFTDKGSRFSLDNLQLTTDTQEQSNFVNYGIHTQIGNLSIPNIFTNSELGMSYLSHLVFRRLDTEALLAIQQTARDMGQNNPTIIGIALFGKLMEVAPQLLAQSPEIILTPFLVKTSQGNIEGNVNFRIDGNKATSLEPEVLISALQGQLKFTLGKVLLEQLLMSGWLTDLKKEVENSSKDKKISESVLADLKKQAQTKTKQQLQKYLKQKWLVETQEGNYKLVAQLQNGKLIVNGQEQPFPFAPNKH